MANSAVDRSIGINPDACTPEDVRRNWQQARQNDNNALNAAKDPKSKVDSGDTTPGYLASKLVGSSGLGGITLTVQNVGGNETLKLTMTTPPDGKVLNSSGDTTRGFLTSKLTVSGFLAMATVAAGGNESSNLTLHTTGSPVGGQMLTYVNGTTLTFADANLVLNNGADTVPRELFDKLIPGSTTSIVVITSGAETFSEIGINWKTTPGSGDNGKLVTYVATGDKLSVDTQFTFTNASLAIGATPTTIKHNNPSQSALGLHSSKCGTGTVVYDLTGHLVGAYDAIGGWFSGFGISDPGLNGTNS